MSTILSSQIITNSTAEVDQYIKDANAAFTELENTIKNLTASGFVGDAADGYNTFFLTKIKPVLTSNLTEGDASLMGALKKMMTEIGEQLLNKVDPALGNANKDAGQ